MDIMCLVRGNSFRQLQLILEAGADVNARNSRLETPLMICIMHIKEPERRVATVRMLLLFGADINAQNDRGQTVFMYACILNQIDSIMVLLEQEVLDLNIPDEDGNTALMYACAMGYSAIAKIILDNYAMRQHSIDITIVNKDGLTALQLAAEREFTDILTMFADTFGVKNWHSAQALIEETRNEKPQDKLSRSKHALTSSASGKQNSDRFYNMMRELKEAQRRETELDAEGIRLRTYDIHNEDEDYLNNNTPRFDNNTQRYDGNTPRYDNVQQRESRSQLKETFRRDKSSSRIDKPRLDTPLPKSRRTSEAGCIADSKKEFKENNMDSVVKNMEYSPKPPDTPRCGDASGSQGVNGVSKSNSQSSRFLRSNWSNYRDPLPGINGSVVTSQADVIKLPPIRNAVMARGNPQRPIKLHSLDQNVWRTGTKFITETNENSGNRQQQNSAFENEENS